MAVLGIDCRFASRKAGLGTFTRELVAELIRVCTEHSFVLFLLPEQELWFSEDLQKRCTVVRVQAQHYTVAEHRELFRVLRASGVDLLLSPHFTVPFFCPVPFIVTVHDLILHRYSGEASWFRRAAYRILFWRAVRKAQRILAVSTFTAQEIRDAYGKQLSKKVRVITEGVSPGFHRASPEEIAAVRSQFHLPETYVLYVGNAKQHKNLPLLLSAHRRAASAPPLVMVTEPSVKDVLLPGDRVQILTDVDEVTLRALYSGARACVTPSLYEGFCLPILEARACGCPVLACDVSAIPEVAGPHALLVKPHEDDFVRGLQELPVTADPPEARYSWNHAATQIRGILSEVLPS